MIDYYQKSSELLFLATSQHLFLAGISLGLAIVLASLLTIVLHFNPRWQSVSTYVLSLLYAIPSFALFALLIPWTGLGRTSAIIVLVIYAQYSLVRSFLSGLSQVEQSIKEAAVGMGMTPWQVFYKIEIPLALPAIFAGVRIAATAIIAIATIAATINAGGLGTILFDGLRTMSMPKLLWGISLTVGISIVFNVVLYLIEELLK